MASNVIPAISHFLNGNTESTFKKWNVRHPEDGGSYYGFVGEFENKTAQELELALVNPRLSKNETISIDSKDKNL